MGGAVTGDDPNLHAEPRQDLFEGRQRPEFGGVEQVVGGAD